MSYRKLHAIDIEHFKNDIAKASDLCLVDGSVAECVNAYNKGIRELINAHAPVICRTITQRPHAPWYTDEIRCVKRERRRLERPWLKYGLEIHHQLYRNQCHAMNRLLLKTRKDYYLTKITNCSRDQKGIYITRSPNTC